MRDYQIAQLVRDLASREYATDSWLVKDLYDGLLPDLEQEFKDEWSGKYWDQAAQEGYEQGLREGINEGRDEYRDDVLYVLKRMKNDGFLDEHQYLYLRDEL